MPIVASRGSEIRRWLAELSDPRRRAGATLRLKTLGARVVPHVAEELGRLDGDARHALLDALSEVKTQEAQALRKRLMRAEDTSAPTASSETVPTTAPTSEEGDEAKALTTLRELPPPAVKERPTISRERGEAHLALARAGSRLARKDLLQSLAVLPPERCRLYCEAAGLIGNADFLAVLARLGETRDEAVAAIAQIAIREKITARSKVVRKLQPSLQTTVAKALARA